MLRVVTCRLCSHWSLAHRYACQQNQESREPNRLRSLGLDARAQFSSGSQVFSLSLTFFGQLPKPMNQPCPVKICVPVDYRPLVHV